MIVCYLFEIVGIGVCVGVLVCGLSLGVFIKSNNFPTNRWISASNCMALSMDTNEFQWLLVIIIRLGMVFALVFVLCNCPVLYLEMKYLTCHGAGSCSSSHLMQHRFNEQIVWCQTIFTFKSKEVKASGNNILSHVL